MMKSQDTCGLQPTDEWVPSEQQQISAFQRSNKKLLFCEAVTDDFGASFRVRVTTLKQLQHE